MKIQSSDTMTQIYNVTYTLTNTLRPFGDNKMLAIAENLTINYFSDTVTDASDNRTDYQTISYLNRNTNTSELSDTGDDSDIRKRTFAEILIVSVALGCLILATVIGNIFVISAIILEKNLKSVGNYLVLSLAVTDLMVACLVMPLGAVYEITQEWTFGSALCELWTCTDVLCCTASILHLLAIACDRFWAVTNVDYVHQRNARHIGGMIATVWIVSAMISLAPILGWKDDGFIRRIEEEKRCLVSQDISYQIFATMFSFYGPSALVLILYYRIYLVAKKRIRRKSSGAAKAKARRPHSCPPVTNTYISTEMTTMTYNISSSNGSNASSDIGSANSYQILVTANSRHLLLPPQPYQIPAVHLNTQINNNNHHNIHNSIQNNNNNNDNNDNSNDIPIAPDFISGASTSDALEQLDVPSIDFQRDSNSSNSNNVSFDATNLSNGQTNGGTKTRAQPLKRLKFKRKCFNEREIENKRERKAAKTLAIITGIFIVCWLPFFAVALIMPLCPHCFINPYLFSFCLWLGWTNSSLNPFLYTIFSPDFRSAFRKIIFGKKFRKR